MVQVVVGIVVVVMVTIVVALVVVAKWVRVMEPISVRGKGNCFKGENIDM